MRKVTYILLALACFALGTEAFAAISGVGSVAAQATTNIANIAKLITAASYVAGMAFVVGAILKIKQHKDNPTQVQIGQGIAMLFIGAALIFAPTVFGVAGKTLFGQSGTVAGVSGVTGFGAKTPTGGQS